MRPQPPKPAHWHLFLAVLLLCFVPRAEAIGVLIPTDTSIAPLAIESHRVSINIKDRTAETKIVQVFRNSTSRQLEATYIFPLPKGAVVSDFALWMNGVRVKGEVLEKDKAREIYEGIVRRMKDPGLLEYVGNDVFQARIFPIPANGTQKVEISFTTLLDREGGVSHYVYPLKTSGTAATTIADFTLTVGLESKVPIKSIYSPTHEIAIQKKDDYHATVGFEYERATLDKDFHLYYSLSKDDIGLDLLTYRRAGEDGYFMLLASPKQDYSEKEIIGKHVTFVIDTSGSMSGEKMLRAKKALIYCLQHLRDDDTFSIVRFSSDVESFESEPKPATKEWVTKAVAFADKLEAAGGTAIYGAMQEALKVKTNGKGPKMIVFLTDGSPTVGETDTKKIAQDTLKANAGDYRLFVFGVGETVNAVLLDQLAADNGGFAEYAKPGAEVETLLTSFYDKISYPVLAELSLEIPKVKTKDLFPRELGDLYKGQQIVLFGRYKDMGGTTITLSGTVDGKKKVFEYEGEFPESRTENDFIPRLWATRKVGYLLEEIRIHGENAELKDEVTKLAKEFGIVTPYTSYLVVEEETNTVTPVPGPIFTPSPRRAEDAAPMAPPSSKVVGKKGAAAPSAAPAESAEAFKPDYSASTGSSGIAASKDTRKRKEAKTVDGDAPSRYVEGRSFVWDGYGWVDARYTSSMKIIEVEPLSDAYFALTAKYPALVKIFALGNSVLVVVGKDKVIWIKAGGKSKLSEKEIKELMSDWK